MDMRLKQLLRFVLLGAMASATATASVSQLSGVLVKSHEKDGLVTILASGAFTHTEYRPTDELMLIDLAGVAIAHPDPAVHAVYVPGIRSYRVLEYRGSDGAKIARIELNLVTSAKVQVNDIDGGVEVRLTGAPAAVPTTEQIAAAAEARTKAAPMSRIRDVAVTRSEQGLEVQITGNGPLTAKTMKLTGPDRLVVDIPNSVLEGRSRQIAVNSASVKDVRVGRFQSEPPVTRVVVDLAAAGDFNLIPTGNKLVLKLHEDRLPAGNAQKPEVASSPVSPAAAHLARNDAAIVSPSAVQPIATVEKTEPVPSRADVAASHFSHDLANVPAYNQPPYPNSSLGVHPAAVNAALAQQAQAGTTATISGPVSSCTSGRYTGEPIGLNFKDLDLKDFFKVIQEISGLNVVLDPAVKGTVSIYLNDVPWDQALAIVLNNNGLECQLQGNVLRIATLETLKTEADARRAQQDAQALAVPKQTITRYLSYGQSRDAVNIVKKFLSPRGDVVADPRSNALIVEDIPSTLPKVEELIKALDRKTPEVEIEARVVASTRSFARDIGTQLGVGFATGHSQLFGAPAVGNSPIITNGIVPPTSITIPPAPTTSETIGPTTGNLLGTGGQIPLFSNLGASGPSSGFGLSTFTSNFRLDFILSAAETRGLIKILSRPHITTQNNIAATVKQGAQIPVVTSAQLGGPPTVQYIAAFLRLTVTPQITADNTIFLNLDVENTTPDFSRVSGAQLNPALDTQQATTSVLVKDGGTVVIGGVVQTQNNLAIAQVPILGSLPILGNLFKHTTVNTQTVELIFFITPKIIET
jgi:type IV pilus assembly protein PilQ